MKHKVWFNWDSPVWQSTFISPLTVEDLAFHPCGNNAVIVEGIVDGAAWSRLIPLAQLACIETERVDGGEAE